jgi:uncharacterized protein YndB with AHSA1/START domain
MTAPTVRVSRRFNASPERVFDAWTDPKKVARWFGAPARTMMGVEDEIVRLEIDARLGGKFDFTVRRQGEVVAHLGEYLEFDRPRRLAFTWSVPRYSSEVTVVKLDFAPAAGGCELTLTHEKVAPEYAERTQKGWSTILEAVASVAEL